MLAWHSPTWSCDIFSTLSTGCMPDVEITNLSDLMDLLEAGDDVMADKGFTIKKVLMKNK